MWSIVFTPQGAADWAKIKTSTHYTKAKKLVEVLRENPYQNPPPYEKLKGVEDTYSRRINKTHRLVYEVDKTRKEVRILRAWTHYG